MIYCRGYKQKYVNEENKKVVLVQLVCDDTPSNIIVDDIVDFPKIYILPSDIILAPGSVAIVPSKSEMYMLSNDSNTWESVPNTGNKIKLSSNWSYITDYIPGTSGNRNISVLTDGQFTFSQPVAGNYPQQGITYNDKIKIDNLTIGMSFGRFSTDSVNSYFGIVIGNYPFIGFDGTTGTVGNRTAGLKYMDKAYGFYFSNLGSSNKRFICQTADNGSISQALPNGWDGIAVPDYETIIFKVENNNIKIYINDIDMGVSLPDTILDNDGKAYLALIMVNEGSGTTITYSVEFKIANINGVAPNNWNENYSNWKQLFPYISQGYPMSSALGKFDINSNGTFTFSQPTSGWYPQSGVTYKTPVSVDGFKMTLNGNLFTSNNALSYFAIFFGQNEFSQFDNGSTYDYGTAGLAHTGNVIGYYLYNNYDDNDGSFYFRSWDPDLTRSHKQVTTAMAGQDIEIEFKIINNKIIPYINGETFVENDDPNNYYQNEDVSRILNSWGNAYVAIAMVNQGTGTNVNGFTIKTINGVIPNNWNGLTK